jgi:hypothetical protein
MFDGYISGVRDQVVSWSQVPIRSEEFVMTTSEKTVPQAIDASVFMRTLEEGYGPGAWHGADLKAAIEDVDSSRAFSRPAPERHSIAEIALHHAYHAHNVKSRLTGDTPSPFLVAGDDWFALPSASDLTWPQIQALVASAQKGIAETVSAIGEGRKASPLSAAEQFDLVLGITCHAVYHAGQIQLLKKLNA